MENNIEHSRLPARQQEQVLIDIAPTILGAAPLNPNLRVFCNTAGRAQFAEAFASTHRDSTVTCHFLDQFQLEQSTEAIGGNHSNLQLICTANIPDDPVDLACLSFSMHGEAELTRDYLHSAYRALVEGGRLIATTENANDQWLHTEMRALFQKVTRTTLSTGTWYAATKLSPFAKTKRFDCQLTFRDRESLIQLVTRPGVFSHRRVDAGARHLMEIMEVTPLRNGAPPSVLDIGCGSGAVSLAAAARSPESQVLGIDANPRAIDCLLTGANLNGFPNISARVDTTGSTVPERSFDLILANPPYYSHHRISELFITTAAKAITKNGIFHLVTKAPDWYIERLPLSFASVEMAQFKHYAVLTARGCA